MRKKAAGEDPEPCIRGGGAGYAVAMALLLMAVLAIMVPLFVMFSKYEAKWSVKSHKVASAFALADAATERGYLALTRSTSTWQYVIEGGTLTGYRHDQSYSDMPGGRYAIWIGTGTAEDVAVITAVGRDDSTQEVRTIQVEYAPFPGGQTVIVANGLNLGGAANIEWGDVISPQAIDTGGKNHPQFISSAEIDQDANGSAPPNTDAIQWWSWQGDLPTSAPIDLDFYRSSAAATGVYCSSATVKIKNLCDTRDIVRFYTGDVEFEAGGCPSCSGCTGGNVSADPACSTGLNYFRGTLIVLGKLDLRGNSGGGTLTLPVPPKAWKQYGNDWSYYQTNFDASAPAAFPGLDGGYLSDPGLTYGATFLLAKGFIYVGRDLRLTGSGTSAAAGRLVVVGNTQMTTSNFRLFLDESARILTSKVLLRRLSWRELNGGWPAGL